MKDATGLLLDSMYHVNWVKRGSACTMQGIVNAFNDYKKALKNTLINKLAIESPDHKFEDVTLKMADKVLLIALVLLWITPQFMEQHSLKAKYQLMQRINYRTEDEIINEPL